MIQSSFWLRSATSDEEKQRKALEEQKRRAAKVERELEELKKRLASKGSSKGKNNWGKDGGKKGKGKGDGPKGKGGYGRWTDTGGLNFHAGEVFLQTCQTTGKPYCRKKNRNQQHDESQCPHVHECNWVHCPDRKNCKGAFVHKKF